MINYGGSITSSFPNTLCSSPSGLICSLCSLNLNTSEIQKCTHCGLNICQSCLLENYEGSREKQDNYQDTCYNQGHSRFRNLSAAHYNLVKKDFKQMYNYSKTIVEKLHLLNNTIKIEESTVTELNLIKHQVNTKALELIKQINQEKSELIEQIENVKRKYESTLNEKKEYFALSMQYKDELRKVIRKYKDYKSEEKCSLNDLLNLYFSVKTISKSLDDYNHIKLIAEQDPVQVKFEERPIYRNLIGKLMLNQIQSNLSNGSSDELSDQIPENKTPKRNSQNGEKNAASSTKNQHQKNLTKSHDENLNKDSSKSFSLNDLINAANEVMVQKENKPKYEFSSPFFFNNLKKNRNVIKSTPILNNDNETKNPAYDKQVENVSNKKSKHKNQHAMNQNLRKNINKSLDHNLNQVGSHSFSKMDFSMNKKAMTHLGSKSDRNFEKIKAKSKLSINSSCDPGQFNAVQKSTKILENPIAKKNPKQRLEIDIVPSHLSFSNNNLLISSSYGKIRVLDINNFKMHKDELKNVLINGICMPKSAVSNQDTDLLYAVANGQMNPSDDVLNVSNSVIIVTKRELKVLKVDGGNPNNDYVFSNPSGICYDLNDNLYVCDSGFNRVKVFDRNMAVLKIIETAANAQDSLSQPKSVSTYQDRLFVCDSANHRIVVYEIIDQGKDFKFRAIYGCGYGGQRGMLQYPMECCTDSKGILYVRDHHNYRVQAFDLEGNPLHLIEVNSEWETIYSMTVNDNGDIYVAKIVNFQEKDKTGKLTTLNKYLIDIY